MQRKDGFVGEKQINIPEDILEALVGKQPIRSLAYITHIGFFPKAQYHFRERAQGSDDFILIYCLEGKGYYSTPMGNFELNANQFFILPAQQPHSYQADLSDPWTICWVHFSSSELAAFGKAYELEKFIEPTAISFNQGIIDIWNEMYVTLAHGFTKESFGYANLCLYHFIAHFIYPSNTKKLLEQMQKEDPLERSIAFMKANISKQLSVEEIATKFHFSPSHYTAIFKKKTGLSPIEYFIRIKIHYACQLLSQRELIIKEIAARIGYDDPYYFSRIFKKVTGKSPAQYKKTI